MISLNSIPVDYTAQIETTKLICSLRLLVSI